MKRWNAVLFVLVVAVLCGCAAVMGRAAEAVEGEVQEELYRILLVDETKTFEATVRVGILAEVLQGSGMCVVSVRLADVESSYADPLRGQLLGENEDPYDVIVIIPKGLDDGSVTSIWIVFGTFGGGLLDLQTAEETLGLFSGVIDQVFRGLGEAVHVLNDFYPAFLSAQYLNEGWLR